MELLSLFLGLFGKDVKIFGLVLKSNTIKKLFVAIAALAKGFKNKEPNLIENVYTYLLGKWDDVSDEPKLKEFLMLQDKAINALWRALN